MMKCSLYSLKTIYRMFDMVSCMISIDLIFQSWQGYLLKGIFKSISFPIYNNQQDMKYIYLENQCIISIYYCMPHTFMSFLMEKFQMGK